MKQYLAANWKMFKTHTEAGRTASDLVANLKTKLSENQEVILFPPFTALQSVAEEIHDYAQLHLGGQNFYPADQGAFTGEISPEMLRDLHCTYALAGHSERRHIFQESHTLVAQKVHFGMKKGLKIILCIGETLEEREKGKLERVINDQLAPVLQDITPSDISANLFIAYEPVWAIGTGVVATTEDISQAHSFVRNILAKFLSQNSNDIPILYGGSVKPENSSEILSLDNVNGVLVGGASLDSKTFSDIIFNAL
jgi:triosephosphate isomerase